MRSGQVPVWATGCCVASEDPLGKSFPRRMDFCVYMKGCLGSDGQSGETRGDTSVPRGAELVLAVAEEAMHCIVFLSGCQLLCLRSLSLKWQGKRYDLGFHSALHLVGAQ